MIMADEKLERIYTVPLGKAYDVSRNKRAPRAVKLLKEFISRHMKAQMDLVFLSNSLNSLVWGRSIQKPPRRIKIRVIKSDGKVRAYLPEEQTAKEEKKPEPKKAPAKAEGKEPEKPKEEAKMAAEKKEASAPAEAKEPSKEPEKKEAEKKEAPEAKEKKPEPKDTK